jgi:uncharacterized protein (TIGR02301 family)
MTLLVSGLSHGAEDQRAYDDKLLRLAELLGSIHYLRELCGADEGQLWRQQMSDLIDAEATSSIRRVRLISSFNKGYHSYRRTYQTCNDSAKGTITLFLNEGAEIAKTLAELKP